MPNAAKATVETITITINRTALEGRALTAIQALYPALKPEHIVGSLVRHDLAQCFDDSTLLESYAGMALEEIGEDLEEYNNGR